MPPTLLYRLHVVPLSARLLGRLQAVYTRHLRAVSRSQGHLTFESTADLHARLGVPSVKDLLLNALAGARVRTDIVFFCDRACWRLFLIRVMVRLYRAIPMSLPNARVPSAPPCYN